jgi:hypothetical protein
MKICPFWILPGSPFSIPFKDSLASRISEGSGSFLSGGPVRRSPNFPIWQLLTFSPTLHLHRVAEICSDFHIGLQTLGSSMLLSFVWLL